MRNLRTYLIALLLTVAMVVIAFLWLDRPISYFVHNQLGRVRVFIDLTRIPEIMAVAASVFFPCVAVYVLLRRPFSKFSSVLLVCGISIAVASQIKDHLKVAFGRTWPETWINNNPSLIRDAVYGFNYFHGGAGYNSFPSGHMTVTCAAASVLWMSYPRYRPLVGAMAVAVAIGLIGANYHFVADVIAGGFIGWSTGWIAVLLWNAGLSPIAPEPNQSDASGPPKCSA